jgi:hypothetical protein
MTTQHAVRGKNRFRKAPKPGESEPKTPFRLELDQRWRDACLHDGADDRPSGAGDRSM